MYDAWVEEKIETKVGFVEDVVKGLRYILKASGRVHQSDNILDTESYILYLHSFPWRNKQLQYRRLCLDFSSIYITLIKNSLLDLPIIFFFFYHVFVTHIFVFHSIYQTLIVPTF